MNTEPCAEKGTRPPSAWRGARHVGPHGESSQKDIRVRRSAGIPSACQPCEDVRCGSPETGGVDVTHRRAHQNSRHRYPLPRPCWMANASNPLSASRSGDAELRVSSARMTPSACPLADGAPPLREPLTPFGVQRRRANFVNLSHFRTSAQSRADIGCLPPGHSMYGKIRNRSYDSAARRCVPVETVTFPGRLRRWKALYPTSGATTVTKEYSWRELWATTATSQELCIAGHPNSVRRKPIPIARRGIASSRQARPARNGWALQVSESRRLNHYGDNNG